MTNTKLTTNENKSKWAYKFCNDENQPTVFETNLNCTRAEEYFEKQTSSKFRENYDCFKPRHSNNVNRKALSDCKYRTKTSSNSELNELIIKLNEVKSLKKKLKQQIKLTTTKTDDQSKFCNSDKSEKTNKLAYRQYKDLKRTKTLLEILINKKYSSIV